MHRCHLNPNILNAYAQVMVAALVRDGSGYYSDDFEAYSADEDG